MNLIVRYLIILVLLLVALPLDVYADSANVISPSVASSSSIATVTSSYGWVITPVATENIPTTITSFFTCVFGVRIFSGADPVGTYSINVNPDYVPDTMSGKVSGHMLIEPVGFPIPGMIFYLYNIDSGASGSYFAITDSNGYYEIAHVPFGNYSVYYCNDDAAMRAGNGELVGSIALNASNPSAVVDKQIMLE